MIKSLEPFFNINLFNLFYMYIYFSYMKVSKDSLDKYYKKNKGSARKSFRKVSRLRTEKHKANNIKIAQKIRNTG